MCKIAIIDNNGNVVVEYTYDAWGNHTVSGTNTTLGNLNPFRYRSYFYDTETGLYFLQTSYYDPEVGRFLNMDSISYADPESLGGLNLYAYCNNNPVMYSDPTGHFATFIIALIIIGVVGLAAGIGGAVSSSNQGASAGEIALNFFVGLFAGMAIAGAALLTFGVIGVIATGVATIGSVFITMASIGAAAMAFGSMVAGSLSGVTFPELEEFPTPGSAPELPTPITGF